jgi:hypothetical protein
MSLFAPRTLRNGRGAAVNRWRNSVEFTAYQRMTTEQANRNVRGANNDYS